MGEFKVIAFVRMIQARNIACHVEFKDFDSESSEPLKCIYDRNGDNLFTTRAIGGVLHHSTTPDFTEEVTLAAPALLFSFNCKLKSSSSIYQVKIQLPVQLHERHHVVFTFYHVSCDLAKDRSSKGSKKTTPTESFIGYAWFPITDRNSK